jgi:peptidyl-prolyl cis-trans isomerase B (cyclophilin B)
LRAHDEPHSIARRIEPKEAPLMKHLMYSFLALAVVACAPTSRDAGTTSGASSPAAAQETASVAPAPEPAPVAKPADEQKPLSYYTDKVAELHTTAGDIHIRFFADVAPNHVRNFIDLAERGFYNGTKFHRVIPGFVIQGGDPNSISGDPSTWGTGNSGKTVALEPSSIHHARGIVSMARGGHDINSASSQFFVCVADAPNLDGGYSAFGQVTKGMDVVDKIVLAPAERTRPVNPESITSITIRPATDAEKGPAPTQ